MKHWIGYFMIIMGILMAAMWSFFLITGMVPELKTAPFTIATHLTAEYCTAMMLCVGGMMTLKQTPHAQMIALLALGMYLYAVIQAPGYYLQQGAVGFVVMFVLFILLGVAAVWKLARLYPSK